MLEQATVEEAADCPARCRAQRTVRGLEAILVHALERVEVIGEHSIERRGLRATRRVGK